MATMAIHHEPAAKAPDGNRLTAEMFARVFRAYMECSQEVQDGIKEMIVIYNDEDASEEEREAAMDTVVEALFPSIYNKALGIDLQECEQIQPEKVQVSLKAMVKSLDQFGDRVRSIMEAKDVTQEQLAEAIGVGQPAVSMMLNRQCRPQRKTVQKIADALDVDVNDLWTD